MLHQSDQPIRLQYSHQNKLLRIKQWWTGSNFSRDQLISPQIVASDVQCVSFWYHIIGNNNYNLVLYQNETVLNVLTTIWNISGDHGNRWHEARIETRHRPSPYQLVFEVIRGDSNNGDIALHDINIDNRPCNQHIVSLISLAYTLSSEIYSTAHCKPNKSGLHFIIWDL
jgi:hypothetical protein